MAASWTDERIEGERQSSHGIFNSSLQHLITRSYRWSYILRNVYSVLIIHITQQSFDKNSSSMSCFSGSNLAFSYLAYFALSFSSSLNDTKSSCFHVFTLISKILAATILSSVRFFIKNCLASANLMGWEKRFMVSMIICPGVDSVAY
jgi:hypothetical protein